MIYTAVVVSKEDNKHITNGQDLPLLQQQDEHLRRTSKRRIPDLFSMDNPEFPAILSLIIYNITKEAEESRKKGDSLELKLTRFIF